MTIRTVAGLLAVALSTGIFLAQTPAPSAPAPAVAAAATATAPATTRASAFKTEQERVGYAIGLQIGTRLKGVDVDAAALVTGLHDAASGAVPKMTQEELVATLTALSAKIQAAAAAVPAENLKAGEAFLAENAKKEGVKTTASGLQYKVLKSGTGKTPKATDTVAVKYKGSLISGKVFDESGDKTVEFPVNHVIPGWTEALQLMKEGDKWQIVIPSKLAYGESGAGDDIGPNETLIFEVELVSVK